MSYFVTEEHVRAALQKANGDISVNNKKISGLAPPTSPGDAVSKSYLEDYFDNISNLNNTTMISNSAISSGIVVSVDDSERVIPANPNNISHIYRIIGITSSSVSFPGNLIYIVKRGDIEDSSWTWSTGLPVYLGNNGILTQNYNSEWKFCLIVGFAISITKICISFKPPVVLG